MASWFDTLFKRGRTIVAVTSGETITLTDAQMTTLIQSYSGALVGTATVIYSSVDSDKSFWVASNDTTGGESVILTPTGGGTSISLDPGIRVIFYADGVNLIAVAMTTADAFDPHNPGPIGDDTADTIDATDLFAETLEVSGAAVTGSVSSGLVTSTRYTIQGLPTVLGSTTPVSVDGTKPGLILRINSTDNVIVSFPSGLTAGQFFMLIVNNPATGSPGTLSWSANYKFDSAFSAAPASGNSITLTMYYDGSHLIQIGTRSASFSTGTVS